MPHDERYGGSATCTIKEATGELGSVSCEVSFIYTSKADAETALNSAIDSQISQSGGTKDRSVSLSLSKK